jgi:hypothetical protein
MKILIPARRPLFLATLGMSALLVLSPTGLAAAVAAKPYQILTTTKIPAAGGIDYVTADSPNRRVYVGCGYGLSFLEVDI